MSPASRARTREELVVDCWSALRNLAEGLSIAVEGMVEGRAALSDEQLRTLRGAFAAWVEEIDAHVGVTDAGKVVGVGGSRKKVESRTILLRSEGRDPGRAQCVLYSTGVVLVLQSWGPKLRGALDTGGMRSLGQSLLTYADRRESRP